MRFSRHARNRLRFIGATQAQIETLITGEADGRDERGNLLYLREFNGSQIRIVVAADNQEFIITVHPKD